MARRLRSVGRAKLLRPALGILISGGCIALLSRSVALDELVASLRAANPVFLAPAVGLYFLGTLVRSLRWRTLLRGHPVSVRVLFRSLVIGLMANDVLPGRLGEIARVFLLARNAAVPVGASVASIVVERVLDGIALTALLGIGILWTGAAGWLLDLAAVSAALFGVATAGLLWAALVPGPARWLGYRATGLAPERFRERLRRLVDTALEGLAAMAQPAAAARVVVLSLVAWGLEASMYVAIMAGFHVPGGPAAGLIGTGVANLATLIPSSPGYVGTFDLALQTVLVGVFDAPAADAASYTLTVHLTLLVPVVALGLFFLWRENLTLPELSRRPRRALEPPVAGP